MADEDVKLDGSVAFSDEPKKLSSRKKRKNFERSQHHFKPRDQRKLYDGARHVRRRRNLEDLITQLDNLRFGGDGVYAESDDDIINEPSSFECLFLEQEKMEIWERFINSSEEDQLKLLSRASSCKNENEDGIITSHHAYNRISYKLRHFLKRKNIPKEHLEVVELALIEYFIEKPFSTYVTTIPDAYQRLVFHAVSQYLALEARSFNSRGDRKTHVLSKYIPFSPPPNTLANHMQIIQAQGVNPC